jgi:lipid-A-disaccharide synthase
MAAAGVDLAFDLTQHSVIGLSDVVKNYLKFRPLFDQLYRMALDRQPDVIVCVDFAGFNRRFAHAVQRLVRARRGWFHAWRPRIVQFVSPQVWASRPGRAIRWRAIMTVVGDPSLREGVVCQARARLRGASHPIIDRHAGRRKKG